MPRSTLSAELFLPFLQAEPQAPRYQQLFRAFQKAILSGTIAPDARLPASRPLAQALKLSRNTVKTTYEMLHAEGYIETRQGAGTFVSSRLPDLPDAPAHPQQPAAPPSSPALSSLAHRLQAMPLRQSPARGERLLSARPCLDSFPWQQWQRHVTAAARAMKYQSHSDSAGDPALRAEIADYLQLVRGLRCQPAQVMICAGSQQAIYLTLRLLLNEGEPVLLEDPGYQGIEGAVIAAGMHRVSIPADTEGFQLSQAQQRCPEARMAILTPSRNYPMGYSLSLNRRLALIQWAREQGRWILEDDYDSEFRFDGPPLTALQGLGGEDCVIYTGTFSRILHPDIRLGYLVLPAALVPVFQQARRYLDGGLPQLPQQALARFMASGQFASHVRRMRKLYQQRRDYLDQQLQLRFGERLRRVPSDGGMHSVYLLPDGYDDQPLCAAAQQLGLGIRPLSQFYSERPVKHGLVIGFAGFTEADMDQALTHLATLFTGE